MRPPKADEEARANDVGMLCKPGERAVRPSRPAAGEQTGRTKSRTLMDEHYWFCTAHAAEYNRSWDFFSGMSEAEVRAHQPRSAGGDRPTWSFEPPPSARREANEVTRARRLDRAFADPLGLFAAARRKAERAAEERKIGKIERSALADMDLDATRRQQRHPRALYRIGRRCHADANGGDRSAENKLQRVIRNLSNPSPGAASPLAFRRGAPGSVVCKAAAKRYAILSCPN